MKSSSTAFRNSSLAIVLGLMVGMHASWAQIPPPLTPRATLGQTPTPTVPALNSPSNTLTRTLPRPATGQQVAPIIPMRPVSSNTAIQSILLEGEPKADASSALAVKQAKEWLSATNRPTIGPDGRVMFTYGAGLPVVVCAPLRICVIELQPGERVNKDVQIGDSVRWIVTPAESGTGKTSQTLVIIKPKEVGLDTNMLIPTDKRSYYIRLISRSSDYVARVAFNYPEDVKAAWDTYAAKRAEQSKFEVASDLPPMSIDRIGFDYTIEGEASFRPVRVLDNGEKTYIQLPAGAKADEIPVLVVLNADGKEQLVNSRFINGWYEVDRLFDRAALILGVGREQRKVVIVNNKRLPPKASWKAGSD